MANMDEMTIPTTSTTKIVAARTIDFTRFKPTGHYDCPWYKSQALARYYRAMMWLALVDFPLLVYDPRGTPRVYLEPLGAATLLRNAMDAAETRAVWEDLETILVWGDF